MNRRGFMLGAVQAAAALAVGEALLPKRTIFLPPKGGWATATFSWPHTNIGDTVTLPWNPFAPEHQFGLAPIKAEGAAIEYDGAEWIDKNFRARIAEAQRQLRDSRLLASRPTGFTRGRSPA